MNQLTYKNIVCFCMYAAALSSCIYYKINNSCTLFEICIPFMGVYFVIDTYKEPNLEYKLHHILCLSMSLYGYYYRINFDDAGILIYTILKTELSTVFLVLHSLLDKKSYWYNINNAVFIASFTKTRMIDMYYQLIHHDSTLYPFIEKYTPNNAIASGVLITSCYVLYGLNVYWFMRIAKSIYKIFIRNTRFNTEQLSQYICSYTYFVSIPICLYMYPYATPYLYETGSVCILAITSYMYHNDMYVNLVNVIPNMNHIFMINDNICIHLRSFVTLYTNYSHNSNSTTIMTLSGMNHLSSIYLMMYTIIHFMQTPTYPKSRFYQIIYGLCFYPLFIDMVLNCIQATREHYIPMMIVNWVIICVFLVEPFDKLNHVAFHLLLMKNTYYQCLMNMKV